MKLRNIFMSTLLLMSIVGCGTNNSSSISQSLSTNSTNQVTENSVKIKKMTVNENVTQTQSLKARNRKNANDDTEDLNYTIITRPQSEVQFTITLDNPKAYGINALEIACDDENAEIMIEGEYKKISDYSIVLWSSENAYEKTYNIKTESLDALTTFTVTDIRLEGETKFQSELTNSTDLGNNELHIYKMDEDAYTLNVIENTFDYIKFNFNIKDEYKDIISNIKVDGLEMDEELGYWMLEESKEIEVSYEYYLEEYDLKVERSEKINVELLNYKVTGSNAYRYSPIWTENKYAFIYLEDGVEKFRFIPILKIDIVFNYDINMKVYYNDQSLDFLERESALNGGIAEVRYVYSLEGIDFTEFITWSLDNFYTVDEIMEFLNQITFEISGKRYKMNPTEWVSEYEGDIIYNYFLNYELILEE